MCLGDEKIPAGPEDKKRPKVQELRDRIAVLKLDREGLEARAGFQQEEIAGLRRQLDAQTRKTRSDYERYMTDLESRDLALTAVLTIALGNATPVDLIGKLDKALELIGVRDADRVRAVLKDRLAEAYRVSVPRAWDGKLAEEAEEKQAKGKLGLLASLLPVLDKVSNKPGPGPVKEPPDGDCGDPNCPFHGSGAENADIGSSIGALLLASLLRGQGEEPGPDRSFGTIRSGLGGDADPLFAGLGPLSGGEDDEY
ncbi:MAG TPA: hypothetical protein VD862_04215 [Candidatus Paceibacterota bacterium]|nr:hypothetical protein [Candidatus Paceibacterota bacterium]